jgi:hypothetical protein
MREIAQRYGGAGSVQQFNFSPGGERDLGLDSASSIAATMNDPNSTVAQIARWLEDQQKFTRETHTGHNTFFSGLNIRDQGENTEEAARQRAQAQTDYESAVAALISGLQQAQAGRNESIRGANAADDEASAQAVAAAQAQQAAAAAAKTQAHQAYIASRPQKSKNGKRYYMGQSGVWIPY